MTRDEHLAWCKERALAYLDAGERPMEALTSMMSDLEKHPETKGHIGTKLGVALMMTGELIHDPRRAREFIEGFR